MIEQKSVAIAPQLSDYEELPLQRALLRAVDYGVLFSRRDGQDVVCNPRCAKLFGLNAAELVRSSPEATRARLLPCLKDPEAFLQSLERAYSNPLLCYEDELELSSPARILRRYTAPVFDGGGVVIGRLWSFKDITRIRRLEQRVETQAAELRERTIQLAAALRSTSGKLQHTRLELDRAQRKLLEAEKLSTAGMLATSIAHDIGNILSPIAIEANLADCDDPLERRVALDAIREQINRLSILTHRLLAYARPETVELTSVDLGALLQRVSRLLAPQADMEGVKLIVRRHRKRLSARGDAAQLDQVAVNIALNALQSMRGEGTLRLETVHGKGRVGFRIVDTGPGIPTAARRHLFEPFFSTRPGGAGLGLLSCQRIIHEHGGFIRVRSASGKGASLSVWLPEELHHVATGDNRKTDGETVREDVCLRG